MLFFYFSSASAFFCFCHWGLGRPCHFLLLSFFLSLSLTFNFYLGFAICDLRHRDWLLEIYWLLAGISAGIRVGQGQGKVMIHGLFFVKRDRSRWFRRQLFRTLSSAFQIWWILLNGLGVSFFGLYPQLCEFGIWWILRSITLDGTQS